MGFRHVLSSVRPSHSSSSIERSFSVYCSVLGRRSSDEVRGVYKQQCLRDRTTTGSCICALRYVFIGVIQ